MCITVPFHSYNASFHKRDSYNNKQNQIFCRISVFGLILVVMNLIKLCFSYICPKLDEHFDITVKT